MRQARVAPGFDEILLPGEPERRQAARRGAEGIEVDDTSWRDIRAAAEAIGITAAEIDRVVGVNSEL